MYTKKCVMVPDSDFCERKLFHGSESVHFVNLQVAKIDINTANDSPLLVHNGGGWLPVAEAMLCISCCMGKSNKMPKALYFLCLSLWRCTRQRIAKFRALTPHRMRLKLSFFWFFCIYKHWPHGFEQKMQQQCNLIGDWAAFNIPDPGRSC